MFEVKFTWQAHTIGSMPFWGFFLSLLLDQVLQGYNTYKKQLKFIYLILCKFLSYWRYSSYTINVQNFLSMIIQEFLNHHIWINLDYSKLYRKFCDNYTCPEKKYDLFQEAVYYFKKIFSNILNNWKKCKLNFKPPNTVSFIQD